MSDYEKFVPAEIRELVDNLVNTARANLERFGRIEPVAFVGRLDGERGELGMCAGLNRLSKDDGARFVRRTAKKHDADFVLFIDEAWLKEFKAGSMGEARRIRDEVGGQVRDMPGRLDVVLFQLETHLGTFSAHVERLPLEGNPGKYTFGAATFEKPTTAEGRIASLLPPREAKQ